MVLSAIDQGSLPWVFCLSFTSWSELCLTSCCSFTAVWTLFPLLSASQTSPVISTAPFSPASASCKAGGVTPVWATLSSHISFSLLFHLSCLSAWTPPNLSFTVTSHLCRLRARNCLYVGEMLFLLVWRNLFCRVLVTKPKALMLCFLGKWLVSPCLCFSRCKIKKLMLICLLKTFWDLWVKTGR